MHFYRKLNVKSNERNTKPAFTLAEILLAMTIIGIVAACLIGILGSNKYDEKGNILKAHKAIETINSVASQIRQTETEILPAGKFMIKNASGSYEYAVLSTEGDGALANASEIAGLFGDYMKKDGDVINFCSYSGGCSSTSVKGFKLPGDLYVGFDVYTGSTNTSSCPDFYMPGVNAVSITPQTKFNESTAKKCWGKLYIDTNGLAAPNTQVKTTDGVTTTQDYYVFGLDEYGVVTY